jgi:hypothetical protein
MRIDPWLDQEQVELELLRHVQNGRPVRQASIVSDEAYFLCYDERRGLYVRGEYCDEFRKDIIGVFAYRAGNEAKHTGRRVHLAPLGERYQINPGTVAFAVNGQGFFNLNSVVEVIDREMRRSIKFSLGRKLI